MEGCGLGDLPRGLPPLLARPMHRAIAVSEQLCNRQFHGWAHVFLGIEDATQLSDQWLLNMYQLEHTLHYKTLH